MDHAATEGSSCPSHRTTPEQDCLWSEPHTLERWVCQAQHAQTFAGQAATQIASLISGRQPWGRERRDEILEAIEDAEGHLTQLAAEVRGRYERPAPFNPRTAQPLVVRVDRIVREPNRKAWTDPFALLLAYMVGAVIGAGVVAAALEAFG